MSTKLSLLEGGPIGKRPQLPGSTPAPGISGQATPYTTKMPAKLFSKTANARLEGDDTPNKQSVDLEKSEDRELMKKQGDAMKKIDAHVNKMVARLPMNIREPVTSILQMAFDMSHNAQQKVDNQQSEVLTLRNESKKKTKQLEQLDRTCDIYRERLKILEEKLRSLQDNIASRQMITTQNKRALQRMGGTNRMLIGSLEALNVEIEQEKNKEQQMHEKSMTSISEILSSVPGVDKIAPAGPNAANEKLRESLLRISREHYTYVKKTENLEETVRELRKSLHDCEDKSRRYQLELDEFREPVVDTDGANLDDIKKKIKADVTHRALKLNLQDIDDRFKFQVFHRNAVDPVDAVVLMRRLLSHVATIPATSDESMLASHLINEECSKLFQVEAIALGIALDDHGGIIKYSSRQSVPIIHADVSRSIVTEIMRTGISIRLNELQLSRSKDRNAEVDSCPGTTTKSLIGVPVFDKSRDECIGTMLLINKKENGMMTDVDEIFACAYAEMIGTWFTAALVNKRLQDRAETLTHLIHAPMDLLKVIPEENTITAAQKMTLKELLHRVEIVAKEALKAAKVRAFIKDASGRNSNTPDLVFFDPRSIDVEKHFGNAEIKRSPLNSGVAGHCVVSRRSHLFSDPFDDIYFNPEVDMDPLGAISVCVPLLDAQGKTVMGSLQIIASAASPTMSSVAGNDGQILFDQACEWLAFQISSQLEWLLKCVGTLAPARPAITPKKRFSQKLSHSFSSLVIEEDEGNKSVGSLGSIDSTGSRRSTRRGRETGLTNAITPTSAIPKNVRVSGRSVIKIASPSLKGNAELQHLRSKVSLLSEELKKYTNFAGVSGKNVVTDVVSKEPSQVIEEDQDTPGPNGSYFQKEEIEALNVELDKMKERYSEADADRVANEKERDAALSKQLELQSQLAKLESELSDTKNLLSEIKSTANQEVEAAQIASNSMEKRLEETLAALGSAESRVEAAQREAAAYKTASQATGDSASAEAALRSNLQESIASLEATVQTLKVENKTLSDNATTTSVELVAKQNAITNITERLDETKGSLTRSNTQITALQAQIDGLNEALKQKDNVLGIMQEQLVKMANDSVTKIDDAVLKAAEAQREAAVAALAQAAADADAAAAATSVTTPIHENKSTISAESNAWSQYTDDHGNTYYHNSITNDTQWDLPPGASLSAQNSVADTTSNANANAHPNPTTKSFAVDSSATAPGGRVGDWVQYFDDAGHPFWVNETTGESSWDAPTGAGGTNTGENESNGNGGYNIEL